MKKSEKARQDEIEYFKQHKVYTKVPIEECIRVTGKKPIGVRWIDVNKQDDIDPKYKSRLVAKEIKKTAMPELYAATPPLEALKLIISSAVEEGTKRKLMACDVSRAYLNAPAFRSVYVKIVDEDWQEGDEEMCGRLNVSMYGTRDA